jgi:hypothetical protein
MGLVRKDRVKTDVAEARAAKRHSAEGRKPFAFVAKTAALLLIASLALAQNANLPNLSARELVRLAVANEVAAANDNSVKHFFRSRKQTPKGSQTRLYVETNESIAAMLIASNDRPLTPQERQGEISHLTWLIENPDQLRKKKAREKQDADQTLRILKALPDAFLYQYDGTEPSSPGIGRQGTELIRLKFTPDSSYSPPTHVEQALTGMRGQLLIDSASRRIAEIDGTLFKDVTFGWGIFGRLNKGGRFVVHQADVGDGTWNITEMRLNITGTILLVKPLSMVSDEVFSDFRRVPDNLTFAQGVNLLEEERNKLGDEPTPSTEAKTSRQ